MKLTSKEPHSTAYPGQASPRAHVLLRKGRPAAAVLQWLAAPGSSLDTASQSL